MEKDGRRHIGWCLDGKNYESWKFGMKLALQSDELWEIVDGTETQPVVVSKCIYLVNCVHVGEVCAQQGHAVMLSVCVTCYFRVDICKYASCFSTLR